MYDGTHYNLGVKDDERVFENEQDEGMLKLAKMLKESGQYIDPNLF